MAAVLVAATVAGCSPSPPNPDPGGNRLRRLEAEPLVRTLPPGAVQTGARSTPAHFRDDGPFGAAGWDGPAYEKIFTDRRLTDQVFAVFARVAESSGWHVDKYSSRNWPVHDRNLPIQWSRSYPDGSRGIVALLPATRWATRSTTYLLTASVV